MIGQYLLNTNERATVSILQNILELNKALMELSKVCYGLPDRAQNGLFVHSHPLTLEYYITIQTFHLIILFI